ncbi:MAG: cation-translocating P-type ATPase [Malacoplasma sp.]|nr:cation-translocating P-type ATPase [Malacoplasma sp.]MDE5952720.1 cation-translocating P-type ATPase [Malacoplasma sp.]
MNDSKKLDDNLVEKNVDNANDITETEVNIKNAKNINDDILVEKVSDEKIQDYLPDAEVLSNSTEVLSDHSKKETGLTSKEAEELLIKYGPNKLAEKKKQSKFIIFAKQLKDTMIFLLFVAMAASIAVAIVGGVKSNWEFDNHLLISFIEPAIILIVIIMYCILGGIQELKSQEAVSSLKKMSVAQVSVMRDGIVKKIDAVNIVPGDLILVEAGDKICADAILLTTNGLECVESALTGESLPIKKNANAKVDENAPIGDQINKIFSGCIVTNGAGTAKVIGTGLKTQVGRIANLIDSQKTFLTPMQLKLHKLGRIFGYSGAVLFILTFLIQVFILGYTNFEFTWTIALTTSISLAVAAIPEGLGAFTTIILSLGLKKMATEYNGLIKRVSSVETLGSTSVICTDKTGTLTLNKMTVTDLWVPNGKDKYKNEKLTKPFRQLVENFLLCTNSFLETKDDGRVVEIGDPTELSVIIYGKEQGIDKDLLLIEKMRLHCNPFDSTRKLMSTVNFIEGKPVGIVKGAPDVLVSKCKDIKWEDVYPVIQSWAAKGYRVIAVATKKLNNKNKFDESSVENNLNFAGLVAMYDPPRPETKDAISKCIAAGIKPVMITGDHVDTAVAIAKEIGIYKNGDKAISGAELKEISDDYLVEHIADYSVYARVSPEDKLRIVKAWQANDQVVAMTGDGVNDAPALKAADIGCAMGITGTDVAKEASDMILMDDNFKTIVASVSNGRKVYQTIKKVIQNILLSSIAEIMIMFLGIIIFKFAYQDVLNAGVTDAQKFDLHIFGASQLLLINLVTDGFPAIALGIQGTNDDLMNRRPFSKYESIFARRMGWNLLWQGFMFGALGLVAFAIGVEYSEGAWFGNTLKASLESQGLNSFYAGSGAAFIALGIGVSVHALSLMSNESIFKCNVKKNWIVYGAVVISVLIIAFVSLVPPVALVFGMPSELVSQGWQLVLISLAFALFPLLVMEINKFTYKSIQKEIMSIATVSSFEMIRRPMKRKRFFTFRRSKKIVVAK